ncbi:MAG: penicillin-binding transpeptidase domain-containing protein [Gemmatimonadales bacterium]
MAKPAARIVVLQVLLALGGAAVLWKSFRLQVVEHATWKARAEKYRYKTSPVPAPRGRIYDRNGVPLAVTDEGYRIAVAQNQLVDTAKVMALLVTKLGIPRELVVKEFSDNDAFFNTLYSASEVEPIRRIKGVYLIPVRERTYPVKSLATRLLGRLDDQGRPSGGVERMLDSLLEGTPGEARYQLDTRGRAVEAPDSRLKEPKPGKDVYLTIDRNVQAIAEGALRRTVETSQARGGDVVILDLRTGELIAIASLRSDPVTHEVGPTASAIVEPFEPGSTSKIFTAGAVLRFHGDTAPVPGMGGIWKMPVSGRSTRTIEDEHKTTELLSLGQTIKFSSNIAISQFSRRISGEDQYRAIRDFGFGTVPGIGFPGESPGGIALPATRANMAFTQPSWAQGYEWTTTALQMASGYGAIANNGVLLAPQLLREVRDGSTGRVIYRARPQVLRQAVAPEISRRLRDYLRLATDSGGTGTRAQLDVYSVIGKTGTAKMAPYGPGNYRASFAGIFPGDDPQWVVYVMIDHPTAGSHFGGFVAAPAVRSMLLQALAASSSPLDRSRITAEAAATLPASPAADFPAAVPIERVRLPLQSARQPASVAPVVIPTLAGTSAREAAFALHRLGLEVRLTGRGRVRSSIPAAGDSLARGETVTVYADSTR